MFDEAKQKIKYAIVALGDSLRDDLTLDSIAKGRIIRKLQQFEDYVLETVLGDLKKSVKNSNYFLNRIWLILGHKPVFFTRDCRNCVTWMNFVRKIEEEVKNWKKAEKLLEATK